MVASSCALSNAAYGFYCDDNMATGQYKLADNLFVGPFSTAAFFDQNGDATKVTSVNYKRLIHGNHGLFQPIGFIGPANLGSSPAVPASNIPVRNPFGVDCTIYVAVPAGVTLTGIKIGDGYGGTSSGIGIPSIPSGGFVTVRLAAGLQIDLLYTTTSMAKPTWLWFGD